MHSRSCVVIALGALRGTFDTHKNEDFATSFEKSQGLRVYLHRSVCHQGGTPQRRLYNRCHRGEVSLPKLLSWCGCQRRMLSSGRGGTVRT